MPSNPALLVGLGVPDDAAVFQLDEHTTLVQTVDFFPPIVDDPRQYGAIAAANALSDIYAMGGRPLLALAIAGFPDDLPAAVCAAILQGGADVVAEAGAVLGGGHTVSSREPSYGLCVTGVVDLAQLTTKAGARPGDVLVLTKPLGTGVITTAARADRCDPAVLAAAIASMLRLNRDAAALARACGVHAATDITGFGLAGHAAELARASGVALQLEAAALPVLPGALECAAAGFIAGGVLRNQAYLEQAGSITGHATLTLAHRTMVFDPQTSGGLLLSLADVDAAQFVARSAASGQPAWIIGRVVDGAGITVR